MFSKKYIIIAIVVLIILVALGLYFYKQGSKKTTLQYLPGELPGNPSSGNTVGASNDELKRLANAIYQDIDGYNILGHNNDPYNSAILLNDTDLIKLYNVYNALYQSENNETLTQALINEKFWENDVTDSLIARLQKLNSI